jgi:hypothetical protein
VSEDLVPKVGFARPPTEHRFTKGRSGNPKGRPRNRRHELPYDRVLGQMVTIREDGRDRRITAAEAFLLQLTRKGLQGDSAAARASLAAIEAARAKHPSSDEHLTVRIRLVGMGLGSVLSTLRLAVKRFPTDEKRVKFELNPWIVQEALSRFKDRQLSADEQRQVWEAVRTPAKVNWPDWWTYKG